MPLEIEIDGKKLEVPDGSTVMDAARIADIYVPHFCYHRKLSIAANCRMCLVQIEKAPKPMPACATPVTNGMKVMTHSQQAVTAQKGVMEFLLINHPLDCPICDQGGECQLQDLAVGYGGSESKYSEDKRVVANKNLGPLISTDMTRCIHCTRCVRFGQEIAGIMELGMIGRGEHSEIITFVGKTVDSELSGNAIDLCPVGALTSKPFRYSARTWELTRKASISPHCGLGSNLTLQIKQNRVMRALPRENEAVNECWISDKDRFSYEGLNSSQRLTRPMVKSGGQWQEVDWQTALEAVVAGLKKAGGANIGGNVGALATPHQTVEELYLLQKLMRGLGSNIIDFRLRQSDFSADGKLAGVPWLGLSIADIPQLDRVLVIGSTLRKDHPLIAHRLRQASKKSLKINILHSVDDDLLMRVANRSIVAPASLLAELAGIPEDDIRELVDYGALAPLDAAASPWIFGGRCLTTIRTACRLRVSFELEPHGPDTFVGEGPRYPWGGLFGGQIVAQAFNAAARTVDSGLGVHSLRIGGNWMAFGSVAAAVPDSPVADSARAGNDSCVMQHSAINHLHP